MLTRQAASWAGSAMLASPMYFHHQRVLLIVQWHRRGGVVGRAVGQLDGRRVPLAGVTVTGSRSARPDPAGLSSERQQ